MRSPNRQIVLELLPGGRLSTANFRLVRVA